VFVGRDLIGFPDWSELAQMQMTPMTLRCAPRNLASLRWATLALAALVSVACDGSISVQGGVYRWVNPPATARSVAIVDSSAPIPANVEPLAGAKVTIYHSPEYAHQTDETAILSRSTATSDPGGSFLADGVCGPGSYEMAVGVTHDHCQPVLQTFRHQARHPEHEMTIILVCDP
jgi:hypothetical protein